MTGNLYKSLIKLVKILYLGYVLVCVKLAQTSGVLRQSIFA